MKRLIVLAALLLSVVGGLTLMSSTSPLAAQTDPSATRSFEPASVEPGGTVTVNIDIEGVAVAGSVTETVPAGFTYVSTTGIPLNAEASDLDMGILVFPFLGTNDFSYVLTAPSTEDSYPFDGTLNPGPDTQPVDVGGADTVTVGGDPVTPEPEATPKHYLCRYRTLVALLRRRLGLFSPGPMVTVCHTRPRPVRMTHKLLPE